MNRRNLNLKTNSRTFEQFLINLRNFKALDFSFQIQGHLRTSKFCTNPDISIFVHKYGIVYPQILHSISREYSSVYLLLKYLCVLPYYYGSYSNRIKVKGLKKLSFSDAIRLKQYFATSWPEPGFLYRIRMWGFPGLPLL